MGMFKEFQEVLSKAKKIETDAGHEAYSFDNIDGDYHLAIIKGAESIMGTQRIKNAIPVFLVREKPKAESKPKAKAKTKKVEK